MTYTVQILTMNSALQLYAVVLLYYLIWEAAFGMLCVKFNKNSANAEMTDVWALSTFSGLWGPIFVGTSVQPNMLNMPKSVSGWRANFVIYSQNVLSNELNL